LSVVVVPFNLTSDVHNKYESFSDYLSQKKMKRMSYLLRVSEVRLKGQQQHNRQGGNMLITTYLIILGFFTILAAAGLKWG